MPFHVERYPANWRQVSLDIRHRRAQQQCECLGECGLHCTHPGPRRCIERNQTPAQYARGRIVLTVAHLCACAPLCSDPAHLKAMCQRCHLRLDQALHLRHAAQTRAQRTVHQNQLALF